MEPLKIPISVGTLGIVRAAAVDEFSASPESVELAINLNFDKIGAVQLRNGLTTLGAQIASGEVLGMSNYRNNAGTTYGLLAKVSSSIYNFNGTLWSLVRSGLSPTSKARFTNFIDLTYMVDGNTGSSVATYNGSTFGSTNIGSLPTGDFIENYRSRIWVTDSATVNSYYSAVIYPTQTR